MFHETELSCSLVREEENNSVMVKGEIVELWIGEKEHGDNCGILELYGDGHYHIVQRGNVFPPIVKPSTRRLIRSLREKRLWDKVSNMSRSDSARIHRKVRSSGNGAYNRVLVNRSPLLPGWRLDYAIRD